MQSHSTRPSHRADDPAVPGELAASLQDVDQALATVDYELRYAVAGLLSEGGVTAAAPSLSVALDAYLLHWAAAGRTPESIRTRTYQLAPLRKLGAVPLSAITGTFVRQLLLDRYERVSHNSVRTFAMAFSAFLTFCVERGWFAASPMAGVEKPRERIKPQRVYSRDQLIAMLAACRDDYDRAMLTLGAGSGLRAGEILGLRWDRIDAGEQTVAVEGKGRKWRQVDAAAALPFLSRLPRAGDRVFPFGYDALRARVQRMARAAGIPWRIKPHELRHTFATLFLEASEEDAATLQQVLGHTSADMTMRYCATVRERASVRKMQRVGLGSKLFGAS